ncbi:3,4-dihydroxy-2-butanone-4-phosphate synthase [Candidatus Micrarchaeota archaeon]|nr:3,4-dihydroxy-2-butanone-4-phosphate synthase [Candidatus Micrarchaeota archaeon]
MTSNSVSAAIDSLRLGKPIILYDGDEREGEADMIFGAKFASSDLIEKMRRDAGGLICLAISKDSANALGLPFYFELIENYPSLKNLSCKKTAYGDRPAFSLSINHKKVYTGIPDRDRALTISRFSEVLDLKNSKELLYDEFYSPGHVFLLISSGLENRKGHTELSIELGKLAGLTSMVLCEMLGSGTALSKDSARNYAKKNNLAFLEGRELLG